MFYFKNSKNMQLTALKLFRSATEDAERFDIAVVANHFLVVVVETVAVVANHFLVVVVETVVVVAHHFLVVVVETVVVVVFAPHVVVAHHFVVVVEETVVVVVVFVPHVVVYIHFRIVEAVDAAVARLDVGLDGAGVVVQILRHPDSFYFEKFSKCSAVVAVAASL